MRVSSKIIAGFLAVMLLAIIVVANELAAIRQLQAVNRDLGEINVNTATTILDMLKAGDILTEDSRKYFAGLDPLYERLMFNSRDDYLEDLGRLRQTARSEREQAQIAKCREALDDLLLVFDKFKQQKTTWDSDQQPPDFIVAVNHFQAQSDVLVDAIQVSINERVASAAEIGTKAEQVSWAVGVFALFLGVVVAGLIVRSINEPLRRLTQGTRVIAKGQFWHRLPARGSDEFAELARDFNMMSERLGELDRMKKDFVSHVSHDLKAPLASIRQIMHLLLQQIPGTLNEQQQSLIQLSNNSAERLASMVRNLLDVSRMEAGAMEYQMGAHDIIPVIKGVIDEFDVQAREKEIRFGLQCDQPSVFVECDRERIVQVIGNLYENALKFSPNSTEIVTRVGQGAGREILISVSDSGPGIPDDHKEKIFEKFHQVKSGKKVAGQGVGLGLAICKTIVKAHRGEIWVEDNPQGGSVFSFLLQPATHEEVLTCGQSA
jgi:two-component system sensor histidine kinase GlrK